MADEDRLFGFPSPTDLMVLVGDIDWPCTWAHLYGNIDGPGTPYRMQECEWPAVWRIKWRELCASGVAFPPGSVASADLTLCHPHFMYLTDYAARRRRGEILHCSACRCEVVDISHILDSWHRIK